MTPQFARRIVRLYPRQWRARYEEELFALLDQSPAGWGDLLDLVRNGAIEWAYASGKVRTLIALAVGIGGSVAATLAVWWLRDQPIQVSSWLAWPFTRIALVASTLLAWRPKARFHRAYRSSLMVYTWIWMVALRWASPVDAELAFGVIGVWFTWGAPLMMYLVYDSLKRWAAVAAESAARPPAHS